MNTDHSKMAQHDEKSPTDGTTSVNGFTFDFRNEKHPTTTSDRIDRIELVGRNPAAGWDLAEPGPDRHRKNLAGEVAGIESAPLD